MLNIRTYLSEHNFLVCYKCVFWRMNFCVYYKGTSHDRRSFCSWGSCVEVISRIAWCLFLCDIERIYLVSFWTCALVVSVLSMFSLNISSLSCCLGLWTLSSQAMRQFGNVPEFEIIGEIAGVIRLLLRASIISIQFLSRKILISTVKVYPCLSQTRSL